ncbi:ABC transporter substrate-binding protein [Cytobacillus depressus]|uniref:ABC transporter substrate-binding protein n=1 Tax=Cytobacillus depressus TaxID=1602942 RepID=A0A6L3VD89_9BACI|nr:ABC transporter substrate-binding protein [Cytobacillus depressus]KAB2338577.1 ABC transporter substrate-binding protein [Cytobacillus depressus]
MKMRIGKLFLVIGLIFTMLSLHACSNSTGGAGKGENIVNIGYSGPLSGSAANYGKKTVNGLSMAIEEINKEGFKIDGKTYKLNLVKLDDKYLPNETAANGQRLVQEHKTPIIITPHSGGIAALQVFNEQQNFIIGGYSSEPSITEAGNSLTIRIPPNYEGYIDTFINYEMKRYGKKIALIPPVTQYGQDWAKAIAPHWEAKGGEVVHQASVDFEKDTDFYTILTNALNKNPDVLFIGGPSESTAKLALQAREAGFKGGFIVMDQAKMDEMKKVTGSYELLEGSIGTMPIISANYPGTPEFIKKYEEKFNINASSEAGYLYTTVYILVEAMKAAKNVDDAKVIREHIQAGLDNLPEDKKVYEIPKINKDGGFDVNVRVGAIENGEILPINVE